uniref:Hypothetical chloroplast RF45 n=1 Tax=Climaconeis cf. scalaris TaxID=2846828 RepID=A0A8F8SRN1_9STRA|nr:hypothetical chloroplast RF45 [Climaconeis cf. scalaris]
MSFNNELEKLIENLPFFLQESLNQYNCTDQLMEIILDLGRRPEARFINSSDYISEKVISWQDLDYITKRISKFSDENRAGIERTLHRVSCIRNRQFLINGLTCRIGRVIFGTVSIIRDLLEFEKSILVLGRPGVGKTTIIREIARLLADEIGKRVVIIDTSNEIAGDSDIPHPGIGQARRMQVAKTEFQHKIMIEAVENHMPQTIIIDEIGTELEVLAARAISEKGVQLIGTTHGRCLKNLIKNPPLADLIGGIEYVTLSDDEAKKRGTQKTILERKAYPAFEIIIEINDQNLWTIHEDSTKSVDLILQGKLITNQIRWFSITEKIQVRSKKFNNYLLIDYNSYFLSSYKNWILVNKINNKKILKLKIKKLIIYSYSLSNNLLKEVLLKLGFKFILTHEIKKANLIIGLKKHLKKNFKLIILANKKNIPVYSINQISFYQLRKLLKNL